MPKILSQLILDPLKEPLTANLGPRCDISASHVIACPICSSYPRSFKPFGLVPRTDAFNIAVINERSIACQSTSITGIWGIDVWVEKR